MQDSGCQTQVRPTPFLASLRHTPRLRETSVQAAVQCAQQRPRSKAAASLRCMYAAADSWAQTLQAGALWGVLLQRGKQLTASL